MWPRSTLSYLLLLLHCRSIVSSSENGTSQLEYYTVMYPDGRNFTYSTGKRLHYNDTTAQVILDSHNAARWELNLTALERSTVLEEFAFEHAQLCGNNSEPDPFNVLPRLEGRSLLINLWTYVDPSVAVGFATLANRFYSAASRDDYRNGYTPATVSSNIYSQRYHELYSYSQVVEPDLRHIGCYGRQCDPISNPVRTPPQDYFSIHYMHWTFLVCYYDNRSDDCLQCEHTNSKASAVYSTPQAKAEAAPQSSATLPNATTTQYHSKHSTHSNSTGTFTKEPLATLQALSLSPSPTLFQSITLTKMANKDCSHSLFPQSTWILFTVILIVLLIFCFFLVIILCTLTLYSKRTLSTLTADKKSNHCRDLHAKDFCSRKGNCPSEYPPPRDQFVKAVNVYETTASMHQSFYDKSVYLVNQTVSEVGSLADSLLSADVFQMKVIEEPKTFNAIVSFDTKAVKCCDQQAEVLKPDDVGHVVDGMSYQVATMEFSDESRIANDEI